MQVLITVYLFAIGAAFGSFALVLADRTHNGKDWVRGRSACDYCGHKLGFFDLVPIISWVAQNGRCRYCKKRLSLFYPLTELGLGAAFAISFVLVPYELSGLGLIQFGLWLLGLILMTALVVADFKWYLLPSKIVYPLVALGLIHRVVHFFQDDRSFVQAVVMTGLALAIGSGLFWLLNRISAGRWIGDGDYRFGMAMAFYLGDPILTWTALFFASLGGLLLSMPVILKARSKMKLKIPFGPFLILGLFISYLVGQRLLDWYASAFLYL